MTADVSSPIPPILPIGTCANCRAFRARSKPSGQVTIPGATALTHILGDNSFASDFVAATSPAFDAQYNEYSAHGLAAPTSTRLIIFATAFASAEDAEKSLLTRSTKWRLVSTGASRFVASSFCPASKVTSPSGCLENTAAEFIRIRGVSRPPVSSKSDPIASEQVRSAPTATALGPRPSICLTSSLARCAFLW